MCLGFLVTKSTFFKHDCECILNQTFDIFCDNLIVECYRLDSETAVASVTLASESDVFILLH